MRVVWGTPCVGCYLACLYKQANITLDSLWFPYPRKNRKPSWPDLLLQEIPVCPKQGYVKVSSWPPPVRVWLKCLTLCVIWPLEEIKERQKLNYSYILLTFSVHGPWEKSLRLSWRKAILITHDLPGKLRTGNWDRAYQMQKAKLS